MLNHLIAVGALGFICAVWAYVHLRRKRRGPDPAVCALCNEQERCGPMGIHAREGEACPHEEPHHVRRMPLVLASVVAGIVLTAALFSIVRSGHPEAALRKVDRSIMGTTWSITATLPDDQGDAPFDHAFSEVSRIENLMSEWIPDSPVSAINSAAGMSEVAVPPELVDLIERSLSYSESSSGAFDITWRGMGRIWNIYDDQFAPPAPDRIEAARRKVDYRKIRIRDGRVFLQEEGMAIGLGAIAKGYAVDRAAAVLVRDGVTNFIVDGGGDLYAHGSRNGKPWRVGIRDPRGSPGQMIAVGEIYSGAFVTSGDYERFKMVDGIRYHHILDPRTGRPAGACRSVTVYSASTETADALATGAFVLGPERGKDMIERWGGAEALIIDAEGQITMTAGFRSIVRPLDPASSTRSDEQDSLPQHARREEP